MHFAVPGAGALRIPKKGNFFFNPTNRSREAFSRPWQESPDAIPTGDAENNNLRAPAELIPEVWPVVMTNAVAGGRFAQLRNTGCPPESHEQSHVI
jgi:hypothetical protein